MTKYNSQMENLNTEGKKPVILIAEDTESNYLLVSTILRKEYEVLWAHNGVEAVDMCKESNPNLILMDIRMPMMNGLEATKAIREFNKQIPIIAVTAFAFEKDRLEALNAGCTDYITKPILAPNLKDKVSKALNPMV